MRNSVFFINKIVISIKSIIVSIHHFLLRKSCSTYSLIAIKKNLSLSDTRLSLNKELPTTKWRRDRRIRLSSEYHSHEGVGIKPLGESNQSTNNGINCPSSASYANNEIPLDMSLGSSKPPPPPYREPLPGSAFAAVSGAARPSVITQAPRKEIPSNQENTNRFSSPNAYGVATGEYIRMKI